MAAGHARPDQDVSAEQMSRKMECTSPVCGGPTAAQFVISGPTARPLAALGCPWPAGPRSPVRDPHPCLWQTQSAGGPGRTQAPHIQYASRGPPRPRARVEEGWRGLAGAGRADGRQGCVRLAGRGRIPKTGGTQHPAPPGPAPPACIPSPRRRSAAPHPAARRPARVPPGFHPTQTLSSSRSCCHFR